MSRLRAGSADQLAELQRPLLEATIANARRTEFYRSRWAEVESGAGLTALPIVHKEEIVAAGTRAQIRDDRIYEKFTGGTSGAPFVNIIGQRECAAVTQYYASLYAGWDRELQRCIRFLDTHTVFDRRIALPIRFHDLSIYGVDSFEYALKLIAIEHDEPGVARRCTMLVAGDRILKALTSHAERTGFVPPVPPRQVLTYSNYLTAAARQRYERVWGVAVTDRYGLSESFGAATQNSHCGWYHFDSVTIPEVVGYKSHQPIREGIGIVLLTPLYPFQECQPLVRYWTGDIAAVTHSRSSLPGRLAIRPLGRACDGIPDLEGDGWLMTPDILFEVLEDHNDVARKPLFRDAPQVVDPYLCGLPVYRLKTENRGKGRHQIIEIGIRPGVKAPEATLRALRYAVFAKAPRLDAASRVGEITVDFVQYSDSKH